MYVSIECPKGLAKRFHQRQADSQDLRFSDFVRTGQFLFYHKPQTAEAEKKQIIMVQQANSS